METGTGVGERADEAGQVRALAREFAAAELRPHVGDWDEEGRIPEELWAQLAELGFFGMLVPEDQGGLGFDTATYLGVLEELAWGEPAVALTLSVHSAYGIGLLLRAGTAQQSAEWLERLSTGETLACCLAAAAGSSSGADAPGVRARRSGERWLLEGRQRWVVNGGRAGLAVVVARLDEGQSTENSAAEARLGAFLVPTAAPGYRVAERGRTLGLRALELVEVRLDAVEIGEDAVLPGAGAAELEAARVLGWLGMAATALGVGGAALEHARGYAGEREQFGQKLREFEGIQFKLAEMAVRVEAGRALVREAARSPSRRGAATAKLVASQSAMWVATQAVQVFGGYGYMRDYPVEKLMRDAKAAELLEGTTEELRTAIAEELYREP